MNENGKLYQQRPLMTLGAHYTNHVDAMTREGLHSKTDIAAELAWRDYRIIDIESEALLMLAAKQKEIESLQAELKALRSPQRANKDI